MRQPKHVFAESIVLAAVLTLSYYGVALYMGWMPPITESKQSNIVEFLAVLTSFSCTYMCNFQTRWNYPMGVLTTGFYSWLFFLSPETTSLAIFNLYLVGSLAYGWFRWRDDANPRPVTKMDRTDWFYHGLLGFTVFVFFIAVNQGVSHFRDGVAWGDTWATLSWIDVTLAAASGMAQFAIDNKKLENWMIWFVIDVISIPYFIHVGYNAAAFQYAFFLANTVWGYYLWSKSYRAVGKLTA